MPWRDRFRRRRQAREWREQRRDLDDRPDAQATTPADDLDGVDPDPDDVGAAAVADDVGGTDGVGGETSPPRPVTDRPDVPVQLGVVSDEDYDRAVRRAVSRALAEDLGHRGDVTSMATVPVDARGRAVLVAREPGVVAGLDVVGEVLRQVDDRIELALLVDDGARVEPGEIIARLEGPLRTLLTAERTLLNLVSHLSGVATATAGFAAVLTGTDCVLRDTRKTTPGLRVLEKRAVVAGGGANHRTGLFDAILVKDNHVAASGGVAAAARAALDNAPADAHVQVEVTTLEEAEEAIAEGVVDLLLDNFTPDRLRAAVAAIDGRAAVEASGRITIATARAYADAGADRLAVGTVTHSAPALDLAIEVEEVDTPQHQDSDDQVDEVPDVVEVASPDAAASPPSSPGPTPRDHGDDIVVDRAPYDDGPDDDLPEHRPTVAPSTDEPVADPRPAANADRSEL